MRVAEDRLQSQRQTRQIRLIKTSCADLSPWLGRGPTQQWRRQAEPPGRELALNAVCRGRSVSHKTPEHVTETDQQRRKARRSVLGKAAATAFGRNDFQSRNFLLRHRLNSSCRTKRLVPSNL